MNRFDAWSEKCEAFYAALRLLDEEYPPRTDMQAIDRKIMREYMQTRAMPSARWFAINSGIPEERIIATEALIF